MGDYPSMAALSDAQLQAVVDEHAVSAATGRCVRCQDYHCPKRRAALVILATRDVLPQRQRGASQPERVGLTRVRVPGSEGSCANE